MKIPTVDPVAEAEYTAKGWWGPDCLTDVIRRHRESHPDRVAFVDENDDAMTSVDLARITAVMERTLTTSEIVLTKLGQDDRLAAA